MEDLDEFEQVLVRVLKELVDTPGVDGHVHFDDDEFVGLVPSFTDIQWTHFADRIGRVAELIDRRLLVGVPLTTLNIDANFGSELAQLDRLDPWVPPFVYLLDGVESPFRLRGTSLWCRDLPSESVAIRKWMEANQSPDEPRRAQVGLHLEVSPPQRGSSARATA